MPMPPLPHVGSKYGAPMGRADTHPAGPLDELQPTLDLQRLPFVDDCYDEGGAYWGLPANVWRVYGEITEDDETEVIDFYLRADSREAAKAEVLETYPKASFAPAEFPVEHVLKAYLEAVIFTDADLEDGFPADAEFSDSARMKAIADCAGFLVAAQLAGLLTEEWDPEQVGHDFWLTRNGHGTGFWDRKLPNAKGLSEVASQWRHVDPIQGDDGLIYFE